jgi:hypothetical protein
MSATGVTLCISLVLVACGEQQEKEVSFQNEVLPILQASCVECHSEGGEGREKSGLLLDSYENVMKDKATQYGPVVEPGNSLNSVLIQVVEGRVDPSIAMPHGGTELSQTSIDVLKTWVDQGAKNN